MKLLDRYILRGFLTSFFSTVLVLSFLMSIGAIFKVIPFLAQGVPWWPVLKIIGGMFPEALSLSIPISLLISSLLVFGRLSSDGEVTAMRACGLSMWQIISSLMVIGIVCTVICIINSGFLAPYCHYIRRSAARKLVTQSPVEMIKEGRFIDEFDGVRLYVGKKEDQNLHDIRIYDVRNPDVKREISAERGRIKLENQDLRIDLFGVRIDPFFDDKPGSMFADQWTLRIPNMQKSTKYDKKESDMNYFEIWERIVNYDIYREKENKIRAEKNYPPMNDEEEKQNISKYKTEISERLVLAFACIGFIMVGVPLGTQTHRRESSIGILMSLLVAGVYFLTLIFVGSFKKSSGMHPHIIIWIPDMLLFILGFFLILRNN